MRTIFLLMIFAALTGCDKLTSNANYKWASDQCKRTELFAQCMAALPKGPVQVGSSNDWDEVVDSCGNQAYYQSIRARSMVPIECRDADD